MTTFTSMMEPDGRHIMVCIHLEMVVSITFSARLEQNPTIFTSNFHLTIPSPKRDLWLTIEQVSYYVNCRYIDGLMILMNSTMLSLINLNYPICLNTSNVSFPCP